MSVEYSAFDQGREAEYARMMTKLNSLRRTQWELASINSEEQQRELLADYSQRREERTSYVRGYLAALMDLEMHLS